MTKKIGFIGYGLRSRTMLEAFRSVEADITVAAVADPRREEIEQQKRGDELFAGTRYFDDALTMLDTAELDGVFIGTRCSLHTSMAIEVLNRNLPLFLEKPVCTSEEQYAALKEAARGKLDRAVVSFPLRVTAVAQEMKKIAQSGELGRITMVQAVNNVPYGSVYYHSWYRDPAETGGLFLQKTTHDIDYIRCLIGETPTRVFAHTEKLYFKGDKPANLHCPDCAEYRTCCESSYVVGKIRKEEVQGDCCCFAVDTGNEDMATATFLCPSGTIISYNQNFMVKKSAARRGCRLVGTRGSAEFDFYTGKIRHDCYDTAQTITHEFLPGNGNHFGGDEALALDYMNLLNGGKPAASLADGLVSAACCLGARRATREGRLVDISE